MPSSHGHAAGLAGSSLPLSLSLRLALQRSTSLETPAGPINRIRPPRLRTVGEGGRVGSRFTDAGAFETMDYSRALAAQTLR